MAGALHAVLGASSSSRWMNCPGSIKLSEGMPNEGSVYAREGSCAHAVAEMCLTTGDDAVVWLGAKIPEFEEVEVTEEMCASVQVYLDCVRDSISIYEEEGHTDAELSIERKFDLSHLMPDMFGTCDAMVYLPQWKKLTVYDYKHGWTDVSPERNSQAMYYALGALKVLHNREVEEIEIVIVQPRSNGKGIKRWICSAATLAAFEINLVAAAKRTKEKDAPLAPGAWCKFCPASPKCQALEKHIGDIAMAEFDPAGIMTPAPPEGMSQEQLKRAWLNAGIVESWAKNVKAYAHARALEGNIFEGARLVEGRSNRFWKNEDEARRTLRGLCAVGIIDGEYQTEPKLKSPKQIEDMLPAKKKGVIEKLWGKGQGALTLVYGDDERPSAKVDGSQEF